MPIFGTKPYHHIWLSTDSCGLWCAAATWTLHIFCWSATSRLVIIPWIGLTRLGLGVLLSYSTVFLLAISSHARAMLSNPGAVPPEARPLEDEAAVLAAEGGWRKRRWCSRCQSFKPSRAHHESVTGRCVVKLDHFCPW